MTNQPRFRRKIIRWGLFAFTNTHTEIAAMMSKYRMTKIQSTVPRKFILHLRFYSLHNFILGSPLSRWVRNDQDKLNLDFLHVVRLRCCRGGIGPEGKIKSNPFNETCSITFMQDNAFAINFNSSLGCNGCDLIFGCSFVHCIMLLIRLQELLAYTIYHPW